MLSFVYTSVAALILLGVTIFVHEFGHYIAARCCGMIVDAFSIGFGPAVWKKTIGHTVYRIGCVPFGGYVALPQIDPTGMSLIQSESPLPEGEKSGPARDQPRELPAAPVWKRVVVSLSGVAGNILLAIVLAWLIYFVPQPKIDDVGTIVGYVKTNSGAFANGLFPGDEITAVEGESVKNWNDVLMLCVLKSGVNKEVVLTVRSEGKSEDIKVRTVEDKMGGQSIEGVGGFASCMAWEVVADSPAEIAGVRTNDVLKTFDGILVAGSSHFTSLVAARMDRQVDLIVERDGKLVTLKVTPRYNPDQGRAVIGVMVADRHSSVPPWMEYSRPGAQLRNDVLLTVRMLRGLVTPRESRRVARGLGGPVMIFMTLWIFLKWSLISAVGFMRFINVNLAILNLLPIPVLDGGHVIFALWEGTTRRKVSPKVANALINVFLVLILGAIAWITVRDICRLVGLKRKPVATEAVSSTNSLRHGKSGRSQGGDIQPAD